MLESILIATIFIILVGLLLGMIIGVAARFFAVESDPRIEEVEGMLPGANCGGCGFAGCSDFAKAVVGGRAEPTGCPVCPALAATRIASFLGIAAGERQKKVAVVLCGGDDRVAKAGVQYNGILDCRSANLVNGGPKACKHGCLGFGSCARVCPFGAIEIRHGLAIVHSELCTGCGKCVASCPRSLIQLVPAVATVHVYCHSPEKGPVKKTFCTVSCIGCRKCVKNAGEGQMVIDGFLARVNYENPPPEEIVAKTGCPTGCLRTAVSMQTADIPVAQPSATIQPENKEVA
jgi:electron transport complex protein RnfB